MRLLLVGLASLALAKAEPFVQGAGLAHPNQFVDQASEREAQVADTYNAPVAPVIGPSSDAGASWVEDGKLIFYFFSELVRERPCALSFQFGQIFVL